MNLLVSSLNCMFFGSQPFSPALWPPTQAQQRMMHHLECQVMEFLRRVDNVGTSGEEIIRETMRQPAGQYAATHVARPVSRRVALPALAATVNTASVLEEFYPAMARQLADLGELLLPQDAWPQVLPRPFVRIMADYGELMRDGVEHGQFIFLPRRSLMVFQGLPIYAGVIEVPKAGRDEGRLICAAYPLNALVDLRRLESPAFPHLAYLFALNIAPGAKVRIWKRDARHFYHFLRAGPRRVPWFAHPLVDPEEACDEQRFPCSTSLPMGFAGSAAFAQGIALTVARRAGLPESQRIAIDLPPHTCRCGGWSWTMCRSSRRRRRRRASELRRRSGWTAWRRNGGALA